MGDLIRTFVWLVSIAVVLGILLFTGFVSYVISDTALKYWSWFSIVVITIVFIATMIEITRNYMKRKSGGYDSCKEGGTHTLKTDSKGRKWCVKCERFIY